MSAVATQTFPELPGADPDVHSLRLPPELSPDVFFDFLRDVSRESIGFETISGSHSSKKGLKSRRFARDVPKKVKKT